MMEESEYADYGDELFVFDNEHEENAVMDQMQYHPDMEHEPVTPYGSAGASVPGPSRPSASDTGRPFSSVTAWQDAAPAQSSPPALSHSPSPRTPATFQHGQQDPRFPSRYASRKNSTHYQHDRPDLEASQQNLGQTAYPPIDASTRPRDAKQITNYHHYERPQSYAASPRHAPSIGHYDHEEPDLMTFHASAKVNPNPDAKSDHEQEYVMITAQDLTAMFNGDEESRITAQKLKEQIIHATMQNGKVVYMVGQATVEWWRSPDMQKRRRAAGRKLLDVGGAVVTGAGSAIMTSTPLGRVCGSVSNGVTAFKASPLTYTMQSLGIKKSNTGANVSPSPTHDSSFEPAIADEDAIVEDWEDDDDFGGGMGMFDEN